MTNDDIRAFLERFRLAWEQHDVQALVGCYSENCVVVSPIFRTLSGRGQIEKSFIDLFKAFSTQSIAVEDVVIGGDAPPHAVLLWKIQSTHVGEIFGMPPSGKRIERTIAFFLTIENGLIAKETRVYDFTSMLMQLGVLKVKPAN